MFFALITIRQTKKKIFGDLERLRGCLICLYLFFDIENEMESQNRGKKQTGEVLCITKIWYLIILHLNWQFFRAWPSKRD